MQKQRAEPGFVISYPRRYLNLIARSLMLDLFRRRAVEQAYLEALALLPEAELISEEERVLILELLQRFDQMLDKLPAVVRQAFLLSRLDGFTYGEIAGQLDVSVRTVKRYMQQAYVAYLDVMTS
jgi:RNA polymerase sigma-70 factor (ECF subfamily)